MSTETLLAAPAFAPRPTTLAELRRHVLANPTLPLRRQRDLASALNSLAKASGQRLEAIAATPEAVRSLFSGMTAAQMGHRPSRWRNIRSLVGGALATAGQISVPARINLPASPAWEALLGLLTSRDTRCRMGRFARYCTGQGIAPEQVDDAVLVAFGEALQAGSLVAEPARCQRETAVHWNRAAESTPAWPQQRLSVLDRRLYYTPGWDTYPASLLQEIEAWIGRLGDGGLDELDCETAPARPLRPTTLKNRRALLRLYLGGLVLTGMDPAEMLDFRCVVTAPRANQGLTFFFKRGDSKPRHQLAEIARLLIGIARHWLKLPEDDLRRLRTMASKVTPDKRGMTDRNRDRLRPLQNDQTLQRVLRLPEVLCREADQQARKLGAANIALARQWQSALLIELLLVVPMRLANLAGLRLDTHLLRLPRGGDSFLLLGETETKNGQPLEARLPAGTAQMLDRYLAVYRPLLLGEQASDWLFPGRTAGSRKSHDALRQQITGTLAERCGVAMHPHLFRHLAGMVILRANPAAHGQVQRVLGHKQLSSTMGFYTGMEATEAVEHYQDTLLARRQAGPSTLRPRR